MSQVSLSRFSCLPLPPQGIPVPNASAGQASTNLAASGKVNAVDWTWKPTKCQLLPNKSSLGQQKAAHVRRLRRHGTAALERSFLDTKSVLIRHDSYTLGGGIGDGRHTRLSLAALNWSSQRKKGRARIVSLFGGLFGGKKEQETDTVATKRSFYHEGEPPFPPRLLDGTHMAGRELKCCYRGSVDGFGAGVFHECCDFKGPCFILAETDTGLFVGAFNSEGWGSTDDYRDSYDAFLFYWPEGTSSSSRSFHMPVKLPKVGGSGAAIFDYARGGPQFGSDGLLIGPPLTPVMGGFAGPDSVGGLGDLTTAKSRLGNSYARREDGKASLFGDDSSATLVEVEAWCSPAIAKLY